MENILPFIAGLAYMAYKVYSNYQKEQEEAKNRNPSQPYQSETPETYPEWIEEESQDTYRPKSILDYEPAPEKYHEPKYEQVYREPVVEKPYKKLIDKKVATEIPRKVELYNPEVPAEEVIRSREIHAPHKHKFVASQEEEIAYSDFDFEDAIIKEAILNRPQY